MEGINTKNQEIVLLNNKGVEKRLNEALFSTDVGCPETVLYELAEASYHDMFMWRISRDVWRCLASRPTRWLRIQKALSLLNYLALNGSKACLHEMLDNLDQINRLQNLEFPPHARHAEFIIKEKAADLVSLICDTELLEMKRKEAADLRSRIVSVSSNKGRLATKILHKPIYALETDGRETGIAAVGKNIQALFSRKRNDEATKLQKLMHLLLKRESKHTIYKDNRDPGFVSRRICGENKKGSSSTESYETESTNSSISGDSGSSSGESASTSSESLRAYSSYSPRSKMLVSSLPSSASSSESQYLTTRTRHRTKPDGYPDYSPRKLGYKAHSFDTEGDGTAQYGHMYLEDRRPREARDPRYSGTPPYHSKMALRSHEEYGSGYRDAIGKENGERIQDRWYPKGMRDQGRQRGYVNTFE